MTNGQPFLHVFKLLVIYCVRNPVAFDILRRKLGLQSFLAIVNSLSLCSDNCIHLRNEFNFWNVHGIMNTSVSCKVNMKPFRLHLLCMRPEVLMIT